MAALLRSRCAGVLLCRPLVALGGLTAARRASSAHALALGYVRKLDDIVKVELLEREPATAVKRIWEDFHANTADQSCGVAIEAKQNELLLARLAESPMFIAPVRRGDGFFVLAMQAKERSLCFTFLEDFKKSPETAVPWLFATVYDDLVPSKGVALLRADFMPKLLSKQEAAEVLGAVLTMYTSDKYDRIWIFNHAPKYFKVDEYLAQAGCSLPDRPAGAQ
ncbi:hypothetical protein KFE25_008867 [Diacronema lutheri]|mgnify:CR=1 FL=1|uniref:ATP synthase mitochondrial F1 complex assembly factor 1 n=3 Tax=Diacronema lutheri TaxID=2081491 RepID=A0A8J5XWQ6_DIALT|nr:hypothetical protein KFE25_008867 [Diacronema lutheri]